MGRNDRTTDDAVQIHMRENGRSVPYLKRYFTQLSINLTVSDQLVTQSRNPLTKYAKKENRAHTPEYWPYMNGQQYGRGIRRVLRSGRYVLNSLVSFVIIEFLYHVPCWFVRRSTHHRSIKSLTRDGILLEIYFCSRLFDFRAWSQIRYLVPWCFPSFPPACVWQTSNCYWVISMTSRLETRWDETRHPKRYLVHFLFS